MDSIQALILAGGLGTRLKPLTVQVPKAMVTVLGKPFLYYLLKHLAGQGITDIVLCTGHLGEHVSEYFGGGEGLGLNIRYSVEGEKLLGTAGAVKHAGALLHDHFLVINGDTFLPIDYMAVEQEFRRRGKEGLMVVYDNSQNTSVANNVAITADCVVAKYAKGASDPELKYVDAGVLLLRRSTFDIMGKDLVGPLESAVYQPLIKAGRLAAYVTSTRFYDIGTPEQLKEFEDYMKTRPE